MTNTTTPAPSVIMMDPLTRQIPRVAVIGERHAGDECAACKPSH